MTIILYILISAASLIILFILASCVVSRQFHNFVDREIKEVLQQDLTPNRQLTAEDLEGLPECVQLWLRNSQVVDREMIHRARVRQTGRMKTSPEGRWMPFEADYYYNVDQPGFVWYASVTATLT